ncbi:hypothetical protein Bca4012_011733 [Brassica carinata]
MSTKKVNGICNYSNEGFELDPKWLVDPRHLFVGPKIGEGAHAKVYEGNFHRLVFFEDRKKMTFAQPLGASSGVFLCRHISSSSSSSSSSCKPEESSIKIDALGDVVPDGSVESVQAMCVIMAIHDFTGFNWLMSIVLTALLASGLMWPVKMRIQRQVWELKSLGVSIQKVRSVIQTCDPKDLPENKKLEAELTVK